MSVLRRVEISLYDRLARNADDRLRRSAGPETAAAASAAGTANRP